MMDPSEPIAEVLQRRTPVLSVEFFPPKDDKGGEQLLEVAESLRSAAAPDFVSITYGAGGTTRERTIRYAGLLKDMFGFNVMPHLTCVGSSRAELHQLLDGYAEAGFRNIMALRGDPPKGESTFQPHPDGLPYACDLVELIAKYYPQFSIGVAGYPEVHPEATSAADDLCHLKAKVDAGASFVTTQLFYDNANFLAFADRCREAGIKVPLVPGLMPIRSAKQARRFCDHIPEALEGQLTAAEDDTEATIQVGIDWTLAQIKELLDHGFAAFHLYIMNRRQSALEIFPALRRLEADPPAGH